MACTYDENTDVMTIHFINDEPVDKVENITPRMQWKLEAEYSDDMLVGLKCGKAKETFADVEIRDILETTTFTELRFSKNMNAERSLKIISGEPKIHLIINPLTRKIDGIRMMDG